ncbi:MAG: TolC family protein [Bradymonadales bacterium]|nr:TolC family protein [Bradymonadales bacterium]
MALPGSAQETEEPSLLTLEQALATTLANHPSLGQAEASLRSAQARSDQAFSSLLPQVSASIGYERSSANSPSQANGVTGESHGLFDTFNSFRFGLSASQLLWDFGQTNNRRRATETTEEIERDNRDLTIQQALLDTRLAYFNATATQAMVQVALDSVANQQRHLEQIEAFVEMGTRPQIDLIQARSDLANARLLLINAENAFELARLDLNLAMGVTGPTDYRLAGDVMPPLEGENDSSGQLLEEALASRLDLSVVDLRIQSQDHQRRAARAAYWPTLSAVASMSEAGSQFDEMAWNFGVGVNLNWSFYQGGRLRAQVREADAELSALQFQRDLVRQQVHSEVEQARLAIRAALSAVEAARESVALAEEQLRLAEGRYENGVGSAIELSDAQLRLTTARADMVQADYNLASARARLLAALGRDW